LEEAQGDPKGGNEGELLREGVSDRKLLGEATVSGEGVNVGEEQLGDAHNTEGETEGVGVREGEPWCHKTHESDTLPALNLTLAPAYSRVYTSPVSE